jgi:two-component system chemotaxis sensor kinase CheA
VLVAEADPTARAFLSTLLEAAGYRVFAAVDGQDALRQVLLHRPSLVLLDLDLPLMDGRAFLKVRSEYASLSRIPVIVVSGEEPPPAADGVIARPLRKEQVLAAIARVSHAGRRSA